MEIKNLSFGYQGRDIFNNYNLSLDDDKITVLMGPSGSGKTTLLRIISGLEKSYTGEIVKDGLKIAYVFQESRLFPSFSAVESITACTEKNPEPFLKMLHIDWLAQKKPNELSGGEQARFNIARGLCSDANYILFDEPFAALDEALKKEIILQIKNYLLEHSIGALFVLHDEEDAQTFTDNVVRL